MRSRISILRLICLLIFSITISCSLRSERKSPYAANYKSHSNGVADIQLQLHPDQQFMFEFTVLPEPGTGDTFAETFTFSGRWSNDNEKYFVRFERSDEIDLYALISQEYEPPSDVEVIDYRTLAFPLEAQELVIWGILCYRSPL